MALSFNSFAKLYNRDLDRLADEIDRIPEKYIWKVMPGVTNSSGIMVQHLVGNLRHFIGAVLGDSGFERNREQEFSNTGISKEQLVGQIYKLKSMIEEVLQGLDEENGLENHPDVFPYKNSVEEGLMHLYGHLNYHLGQVNYLRRIIEKKG